MKDFRVRMASVTGEEHLRLMKNNQDAIVCDKTDKYIVAVISDGSSTRSIIDENGKEYIFATKCEVGAYLIAEFVKDEAIKLLLQGYSLSTLCEVLYQRTLKYLKDILDLKFSPDEIDKRVYYLTHYLAATIFGVIITPKNGIIFSAGDGRCILNDKSEVIHQNNLHLPNFMIYHLLPKETLPKEAGLNRLEKKFRTKKFKASKLKNLAIATDGVNFEQYPKLQLQKQIWNKEPRLGLQWQFVTWSREGKFKDDATMITVERIR